MNKPILKGDHANILRMFVGEKIDGYHIPDNKFLHDLIKWGYIIDNKEKGIYREIKITSEGEDALKNFEQSIHQKVARKICSLNWNSAITSVITAIIVLFLTYIIKKIM
jgi:hypothetical protein